MTLQDAKPQKHTHLTFYLRTLLYMFVALLLRLVAFAPLGFLLVFPAGSHWQWLALLCPVLLVFFILPLRFSFGDALVQPAHHRFFSFDTALSTRRYGEKLGEGLLHLLNVAKWAIPLAGMLGFAYWQWQTMDIMTLISTLTDLGKQTSTLLNRVANFFLTLFGNLPSAQTQGGLMEGLLVLVACLGLGLLILLWGAMRNSAYRYLWALALHQDTNPRTEARRHLRGRRMKQLLVALGNLLLWVPFLYALYRIVAVHSAAADLSTALMNTLAKGQVDVSGLAGAILPVLAAFLVLYMPLLPIRRIVVAYYATRHLPGLPQGLTQEPAQSPALPLQSPLSTYPLSMEEDAETVAADTPAPQPAYIPQPVQNPTPVTVNEAYQAAAATVEAAQSTPSTPEEDAPFHQEEAPTPPRDTDPPAFTMGQ